MVGIELPYHLLIPLCISVVILILIIVKRVDYIVMGERKLFWISLLASMLWYAFVVGTALYDDVYCQREYNKCLDEYGLYTQITPDCDEAMGNLISDTGRVFAPVLGFIMSCILFVFVYLLGLVISPVIKARKWQK